MNIPINKIKTAVHIYIVILLMIVTFTYGAYYQSIVEYKIIKQLVERK